VKFLENMDFSAVRCVFLPTKIHHFYEIKKMKGRKTLQETLCLHVKDYKFNDKTIVGFNSLTT